MSRQDTLMGFGLVALALSSGCAATTTTAWGPGLLQERAFHRQSLLGLCELDLDPALRLKAPAYARVYQYALAHSGAFGLVPKGRLVRGKTTGAVPLHVVAQMNNLNACLRASARTSITVGFSKRVVLTTEWEVVGQPGWKLEVQTEAEPTDTQGMFPNVLDPRMQPLLMQLAWENATQFVSELAKQGMTPDLGQPSPTPAAPGPVPPNAVDWITKEAVDARADDLGPSEKLVVAAYYEYGARVPNIPIHFVYYDGKARKAVAKTVATDQSGLARLAIPAEPDGASSIFAFSLRDDVLPMLRANQTQAIRIPPTTIAAEGAGRKAFVAKLDGESRDYVGSIQLMEFPTDGTDPASYSGGDVVIVE